MKLRRTKESLKSRVMFDLKLGITASRDRWHVMEVHEYYRIQIVK